MSEGRLGTRTVAQIGLVVSDVEATAEAWAKVFGLPVPEVQVTATVDEAHTEYRGQPTPAQARLAFFHFDNVDVELIEPIGGPSTWREHLEQHGDSLHHIAFRIQGMPEKLEYLSGQGITLIQRGDYTGGRYAYLDAVSQLGLILELLERV